MLRVDCLSADTVTAFLSGRLGLEAVAVIEHHARGCAACLDLLATAAGQGEPRGAAAGAGWSQSPSRSSTQAWSRPPSPPWSPSWSQGGPRSRSSSQPSSRVRPAGARARARPLVRGSALGRYVILGLVGRGGMGEVYAAYDPKLDRRVAVKLLGVERTGAQEGEARARLLSEAKAIARLSHPNVVVVYDAETWQERVFVAMEFVEGDTLARWLTKAPRRWREIRDVFVGAGRGLAAAHAAGLVHRDFKPQNVMVGRDGQARVMDFGLARRLPLDDREGGALAAPAPSTPASAGAGHAVAGESSAAALPLTRTGVLLGTPSYMAPEQFQAQPADSRSDQFSFCVALFEALYGERPFAGQTLSALKAAVLAGRIREPLVKGAVPTWLRRIVLRGLRTDRQARFASMEDLLDALERRQPRLRRRVLIAAVVMAALFGAGVGVERLTGRTRLLCRAGGAKLAAVWDPAAVAEGTPHSRRLAVRGAFLATGLADAAQVWERVSRALDQYAGRWTAAYTDTCEATHVRGDQSAEVLDLRMGCLQERLGQIEALTDVLASADASVLMSADDAVDALVPVERCANVPVLLAVVPLPKNERTRAAADELRRRAFAVRAERDAGRIRQGLQAGLALVGDARAVGYEPLLAEALDLVGSLQWAAGEHEASEQTLAEAVWVAEASRHDEVVAEAAAFLGGVIGYELARPDDGEHWARLAEAVLDRMGPGHERARAWILTCRGAIRNSVRDFAAALTLERAAVALKEKVLGPDHPDVANSLIGVDVALTGLGDPAGALAVNDRALAIYRRAYGDAHPLVAQCLSNSGEALNALGRYAEARAAFDGAVARWEAALGPDHRHLAYALTGLGQTEIATGEYRAAMAPLERALIIRSRHESDAALLAETRFALARALWLAGGDRSRARGLAAQAKAAYAAIPALAPRLHELESWSAEH
jgi:serine/threonine protein kinase/tetratricopeptide (TPR) repeat protein